MSDLIEQLEYAACGQGPDAEQTLYWRARNEIKRLRDVLEWSENNCSGKCKGVIAKALQLSS